VIITPGERLSFLQQDHFKYDEFMVLDTVIMGNQRLYDIMKEKDALYAKEDFTEEDGIKASELEGEFAMMDGWNAESDAATLLNGLGIETDLHYKLVKDLTGPEKVKVLLAQALFGNPDILLLDEPTNHLDLDAIAWLEEFLINFENTVIVVSHDRYFLNKVCTQIADIDYGKIQLYAGNYDFWYESSQLLIRQMKEANRKKEEKIKELQEFISRFSANASKSKQATSRKRALEKIQLDEIRPSSRKYPYIDFRPNRSIGNEVLMVEGLSKIIDGVKVLDDLTFTIGREDKVAFVGGNELAKTTLFKILMGEMEPDAGTYKWGVTTTQAYFPKDSSHEFDNDDTIVEWLTQYSEEKDVTYVRGFLGRMLFAGDDGVKKVKVLSGGEKVRCLLSKMMISGANVLVLDEPTDHLDMEAITALNNGMMKFPGVLLFASRDHQIVQTTANRIMEIVPGGKLIDKITTYDEYLESDEMARKRQTYTVTNVEDELGEEE
ncbi:MAG: ATP-binding cassette domain-containing protein, partial [Tyzzerella sp.]|nr:ATP-binding cassette domain-containing protein [Tyzzerella sp.]